MDFRERLSPNFSIAEGIASGTAAKLKISNEPPIELLDNGRRLFALVEKVRALPLLGSMPWIGFTDYKTRARLDDGKRPYVTMHSIYRSAPVNAAVGGSKNSAHMDFRAIDFDPPSFISHDQLQHAIGNAPGLEVDVIAEEGTVKLESEGGSRWLHMQVAMDGLAPRHQVVDWTVDKLGGKITRSTPG